MENGEGEQGKSDKKQWNVCKNYGGIGLLNFVERIEKIMEFFFLPPVEHNWFSQSDA